MQATALPALPDSRSASGLKESLIPGKQAHQAGPGALGNELGMALQPDGQQLAWAMYAHDPGTRQPDSISVLLQAEEGASAYIALPDYAIGRWEWHGPFHSSKTLAIDEQRYRSPSGALYCLVANSSPASLLVQSVSVRTYSAFNKLPVASLLADVSEGTAPLSVSFDASASLDSDGSISYYLWDLDGDGSYDKTSFSPLMRHLYPDAGDLNPAVAAVDDEGGYGTASLQLSVHSVPNLAPVAVLEAETEHLYAPFEVSFSASASTDPDGSVLLYEWDFEDDGTFDAYGTSPHVQHLYPLRGIYTARLRVTDNLGLQSEASIAVCLPSECPLFGMDSHRSRQSPYSGPGSAELSWTYDTGAGIFASPVLAPDGTIYVGSMDHSFHALKPDGSLKWSFPTEGIVYGSAAIADDGTVYFGSEDGQLYALHPDGSLRWEFATGKLVFSSPVIGTDGTIFFGGLDNKLHALYPDGTQKWAFDAGDWVRSSPAIAGDGSIYFGCYNYNFYALNADGSLKWSFPTGKGIYDSPSIAADGTIYFGSFDDNLYAMNPDGSLKWTFPMNDNISCSPSIAADGTIYCGGWDGHMYAINPDGSEKWKFKTGHWIISSPAIGADGLLYFGSTDNRVYCLNPDGSQKWRYITDSWVRSSPAISASGRLYIGSEDGKLYAFGN